VSRLGKTHEKAHEKALACFVLIAQFRRNTMSTEIKNRDEKQSGRVMVPALLYFMGVPFGLVLLLWFFFFRG
jgi:cytoskeletal protein RodZ